MIRKYKGLVLFVMIGIFIICGLTANGKELYKDIYRDVGRAFSGTISFEKFTEKVSDAYSEKTGFHNDLIDLNSLALRIGGRKVLEKDEMTAIVMDNGFIGEYQEYINDYPITHSAERIDELYQYVSSRGKDFLYVQCPVKGYDAEFPAGYENYIKANCDRFNQALDERGIPNLYIQARMEEEGLSDEDVFFVTDHHWKPKAALWAVGEMMKELNSLYGFEYQPEYCDLSYFNVETKEKWFLGAEGKQTGAYFTKLGVDDFDVITPNFETFFYERQPKKHEMRFGNWSNTVMSLHNVMEKNLHEDNPYAAYSGGDFRIQYFKNEMAPNNDKLLIIRDSYACAASPFLALQYKTVCNVDIRDYKYFHGRKVDVYDFIKKYKPDCVMVMYGGAVTEASSGRIDFRKTVCNSEH